MLFDRDNDNARDSTVEDSLHTTAKHHIQDSANVLALPCAAG